jgi:endonuclease/exonuclease/phosphatase family metal-dependent hydrolase
MSCFRLCSFSLLCVAAAVVACSDDEAPTGAKPATLTAVSYNGGLAVGFVEASEPRAPLTIAELAKVEADLICVQEFWRADHVEQLKAATAAKLPHAIFPDPQQVTSGAAACAAGETDALLGCVQANECDKLCSDALVGCALEHCLAEFSALPADCKGCVQANIGNEIDVILNTCLGPAGEYAYGGSFGIGLLSAEPLLAQETKVFESTTNRRAVIYGKLNTAIGEVHAFCTHLTAVFKTIPYPKATGSWAEEQAKQIDEMIQWAGEKAGADGKILIMGDLNTGPAGDGYIAEVPANYQKLVDAGFENPYTAQPGHLCTFCADNPIIKKASSSDDKESVVIDHVLTRGFAGISSSGKRVLDQPIQVENCAKTITTGLSDHYGASITFSR